MNLYLKSYKRLFLDAETAKRMRLRQNENAFLGDSRLGGSFSSAVRSLMNGKCPSLREGSSTFLARVRLFIRVSPSMGDQVLLCTERFPAHFTYERLLARVYLLVILQRRQT